MTWRENVQALTGHILWDDAGIAGDAHSHSTAGVLLSKRKATHSAYDLLWQ